VLSSVRLQLGYGLCRLWRTSPQKSAPSGALGWCEEELKSSGTVMAQVGLEVQLNSRRRIWCQKWHPSVPQLSDSRFEL